MPCLTILEGFESPSPQRHMGTLVAMVVCTVWWLIFPSKRKRYRWKPDLLFDAVSSDKIGMFKAVIRDPRTHLDRRKDGFCAIHIAIRLRKLRKVELLIDAGCDLNIQDPIGMTALMQAASIGFVEAVNLLLRKGGDAFMVDARGLSAEQHALFSGNRKIAQKIRRHISETNFERVEINGQIRVIAAID